MEYPILNVKQNSRQMIDTFLGYNHNLRINENEFYDMKNMSSDYYPVLAPRKKRGFNDVSVNGIIDKNGLCYVEGSSFCIGVRKIDMGLSDGEKNLISMGAYVIIMPDRKYINTVLKDGEYEWGDIDAVFETADEVKFTLCTLTGEDYDEAEPNDVAPTSPEDGQLWIDTSSTPNTLKKYYKANGMWVSIATTYIKIQAKNIGKDFNQYDGVKISGITADGVTSLNGYHVLQGCKPNEIIVIGMLDKVTTQPAGGKLEITRKMPIMDFIVESNNRLWGCKYGLNEDSVIVNEIYASKLGDFKNWNCSMGIATDSWYCPVGTDGPFTGAISYLGYPLFFKEDCIHKVYGDYPANYQTQDVTCRGVQALCEKTLAIVNGTLFYKSFSGVCAYDGSMPVEISSAFGDVRYGSPAAACAFENKYYINMKESGGPHRLFVYDTEKGLWHKEDNIRVDGFCSDGRCLYAIEHDTKRIITLCGHVHGFEPKEDKFPWMVESGIIGMSTPDMKYISKLVIRMSLELGASVSISIQYDSMGDWEQVCSMTSTSLRSFSIPIRPRRCDHFRIRIEGEGDGRIYSITKTIEQGSDVS